jgi:hypothetical protein
MTFGGTPTHTEMTMLKPLKAKITSLYGEKIQRVMLDNDEPNRLAGKRPALSNSSDAKTTGSQNDPEYTGRVWEHPSMKGIIRAFTSSLRRKHKPIAVDEVCRVHGPSRAADVTDGFERSVGTAIWKYTSP